MSRPGARRRDYRPCPAADAVLDEAAAKWPELNEQALIDKLVICGMSALQHQPWTPPALPGRDRTKWRTPRER